MERILIKNAYQTQGIFFHPQTVQDYDNSRDKQGIKMVLFDDNKRENQWPTVVFTKEEWKQFMKAGSKIFNKDTHQ